MAAPVDDSEKASPSPSSGTVTDPEPPVDDSPSRANSIVEYKVEHYPAFADSSTLKSECDDGSTFAELETASTMTVTRPRSAGRTLGRIFSFGGRGLEQFLAGAAPRIGDPPPEHGSPPLKDSSTVYARTLFSSQSLTATAVDLPAPSGSAAVQTLGGLISRGWRALERRFAQIVYTWHCGDPSRQREKDALVLGENEISMLCIRFDEACRMHAARENNSKDGTTLDPLYLDEVGHTCQIVMRLIQLCR